MATLWQPYDGPMTASDNKSVVQEFYDQWNSGAIDFDRLVREDITNHQPDRDPDTGLDKFRQAVNGVMGAVPDSEWTTLHLIEEGDQPEGCNLRTIFVWE